MNTLLTFPPLKIGALCLRNNVVAAPLAGLSSLPYRILAMECGCALAISEMVSAEGAIRAQARTRRYFANDERVRPFGVQLFGAEPESMAAAIRALEGEPVDLIDINMGCPVKKVVSKGAGSALMKTPRRAAQLIKAVRAATALPLTVKIRAGWDDDSINCVEMARIAQECGADAVTVHPRTRVQEFRGKSDWRLIGEVKSAVRIPVIGNGDVHTRGDAMRMAAETGCDGVMIGRAALGNPWVFAEILGSMEFHPTAAERGRTATRHLELLCGFMGEKLAVLNMRAILPWYGKGMRGVHRFMQECHTISSASDLKEAIEKFFASDFYSGLQTSITGNK
ncbi:MAG: tRNA dihydrouridine synthase DusB [bacterium]